MLVHAGAGSSSRGELVCWECWRPVTTRLLVLAIALLLRPVAAAASATFSIGTEQLRFAVTSTRARWGCLSAVHIGGDPHPTENGALRTGYAGTPLWRLTATSCNTSVPAAALALDSCTVACADKYLVAQTVTAAHMRWEQCTAADGYSLPNTTGRPATLDIDVVVTVVGGTSTWTGTIGKQHAAGVCLQSFALPSMESLRFKPAQ